MVDRKKNTRSAWNDEPEAWCPPLTVYEEAAEPVPTGLLDANGKKLFKRPLKGVLGFDLRTPYKLHRQKAFLVPGIVPPQMQEALSAIPTWDDWDPDVDRWHFEAGDHEFTP